MKSLRISLSLLCGAVLLGVGARDSRLLLAQNQGTQLPTEPHGGSTQPLEPTQARPQAPRPPGEFTQPDQGTAPRSSRFDPAKAREEAQKLAALANKISAEVDQVSRGAMPKDLITDLKEIQKVAKRLRGEIAP